MMKVWMFVITFFPVIALGQNQPANDTLIPDHPEDSVQHEPKLPGGALIDTVNIKKQPQPFMSHDAILKDSNHVKPRKDD